VSVRGASQARLGAVFAVLLAACGAQQHPGEPTRLSVITEPENTRVRIDDRDVGSARVLQARPPRLTRGRHQVSVEADGYFPHDVEVDLPPGTTTLRVQLRPIPR
jgi:hypothetical protein